MIAILIAVGIFGGAFIDPQIAIEALDAQAYTDIRIIDRTWLFVGLHGCDGRDRVKFTAAVKDPAGRPIEVYVCSGFFGGATLGPH
jgi:hypothetical protein